MTPVSCEGCGDAVDVADGTAYLHGDGMTTHIYCSEECYQAHAE